MREANTFDLSLLILLAIIWGSAFFNIKIATYSYDPFTFSFGKGYICEHTFINFVQTYKN